MPVHYVKASPDIVQLMDEIRAQYHPHLDLAKIAVEVVDSKPYVKDRLNLGKVSKFSKAAKLWLPNDSKFDFRITLCADVWYSILNNDQRPALLDLNLCRCQVQYEPNTVEVNGKKQIVRDEWGRTEYTNQVKYDDEGAPVWKIEPLDAAVLAENIKRFGVWYEEFLHLKQAIDETKEIDL